MAGLVIVALGIIVFVVGNVVLRKQGFAGGWFPLLWRPKKGQTFEDWFPKDPG